MCKMRYLHKSRKDSVNSFGTIQIMKSYKYRVQGRVQGVFYRASIQEAAQEKGFSGYVQNLPDGSVEAGVSCADERECQEFEAILRKGSKLSRVSSVTRQEVRELFSGGFEIKR